MLYHGIMTTYPSVVLFLCLTLASVLGIGTSNAAPTRYQLDTDASQVGFLYVLNGAEQKGTMPVSQANLTIDPLDLQTAQVDVSVDVRKARTGLIFATEALKARSVLDSAEFPSIRFVATEVQLGTNGRISDGAVITGNLTMRGVTKPITFEAHLYRIQGSQPEDLSQLTIRLTGSVTRSDFGANGFSNLVGDVIKLDILARIVARR
ncbi:MAG: YceI family protein [Paracoccaceae bacterium]